MEATVRDLVSKVHTSVQLSLQALAGADGYVDLDFDEECEEEAN